jgi:hypothetical protein
MEAISNICESCKTKPSEVNERLNEVLQPYHLCIECHIRLINYALRPLEFFNLAAIHGHSYYLHDDFYDFDTGEAMQPKIAVIDVHKFPFPDLQAIKNNLEKLIDFACVQYGTSTVVIELLKEFEKKSVLDYLSFKVNYNRAINYKTYEIAARVLGLYAVNWVRHQWNNRKENELLIFAPALAHCLPFDEAFQIVTMQIEQSKESSFAENSAALLYFQSSKTLRWIERIKDRITNVSTNWGTLSAASEFDWQTAQYWLDSGRPLSLIALDALVYCTKIGDRTTQTLWLIEHTPTLLNPSKPEVIANTLKIYLTKDSVPRTKNAIRQIINNLFYTAAD